jgi:hypothetical protein
MKGRSVVAEFTPQQQQALTKARKFYSGHDGAVGVFQGEGIPEGLIKSGVEGGPWGGAQRGGVPRGTGWGFTQGGPSQGNVSTHVEGHAAAIMWQRNLKTATLIVDREMCGICARDLSAALPPGSTLIVISESEGRTIVRSSHALTEPPPPLTPVVSASMRGGAAVGSIPLGIPTTNSKVGRIVGNQNAMAALGQMLGSLALTIGEHGIERLVRSDLQTKKAKAVAEYLSRGDGVLVIIGLAQWKIPDFNGQRNKILLSVYIEPGRTQEQALGNWRRTPRYLQGAPEGWEPFETYSWIEPTK